MLGALVYRPVSRDQLNGFRMQAAGVGLIIPPGDGPSQLSYNNLKLSISYVEASQELGIEVLSVPSIFGLSVPIGIVLTHLIDGIRAATGLNPSETS